MNAPDKKAGFLKYMGFMSCCTIAVLLFAAIEYQVIQRSEEHTSELQSH